MSWCFGACLCCQKKGKPHAHHSKMDLHQDRISDLPGHITDKILSLLPIRDAIRMSFLSSEWRYKWVTIPDIVFDDRCISIISQDLLRNKLVNIVDHVLLLHAGQINKFKLSHHDLKWIPDIDRWILYLSRIPVKEFILDIWRDPSYKLPSCLYSCQNLIHLEIFNCSLDEPPLTFGGFSHLRSLNIQHITMTQDVFENLISSCPLLEKLTLFNCDSLTYLNIRSPNLQILHTGGAFEDVNLKDTALLRKVSIGFYENVGKDKSFAHRNSNKLLKFFSHLPNLQSLDVENYFLKYLAVGIIPGRLPCPCLHLNYLSIRINLKDWEEKLAALCIFRSSPNLKALEILTCPDKTALCKSFWHEEDHRAYQFEKLKLVTIVGKSFHNPELDLISAVLLNSPVLERMILRPSSSEGRWEFVKELLQRPRASARAVIVYAEP